jgi:hypothetical protein
MAAMFVRSAGAGRSTAVRQTAIAIPAGFSQIDQCNRITSKGTPILSARLHACPMWCIRPRVQLLGARVRYAGASTRGQGSASRPRPRACRARVGGWSISIVAPLRPPDVITSDDRPRSAMPPLGLAERVERRLDARTVRQRPERPMRLAHVRADPISVLWARRRARAVEHTDAAPWAPSACCPAKGRPGDSSEPTGGPSPFWRQAFLRRRGAHSDDRPRDRLVQPSPTVSLVSGVRGQRRAISWRSSASGRVFSTSDGSSQPRRAWSTPKRRKSSCAMLEASEEIATMTRFSWASLQCTSLRSRRSGRASSSRKRTRSWAASIVRSRSSS